MESIRELKNKAVHLEPAVRIGKNGLTESSIAEIKKHLKKKKLVKVKMLSAFLEDHEKSFKKEAAKEIAEKTGSQLIDLTGFVVTLHYMGSGKDHEDEGNEDDNTKEELADNEDDDEDY